MNKFFNTLILLTILLGFFWKSCISTSSTPEAPKPTIEIPAKCGARCMDSTAVADAIQSADLPDTLSGFNYRVTFFCNTTYNQQENIENVLYKNINALNKAFKGYIKFEPDSLIYFYESDMKLDDLHTDRDNAEKLLKGLEYEGHINVFITKTESSLLGFTMVFNDWIEGYEMLTPTYDRIFLSYKGLQKPSSLIHEMGHFFSLGHTFEDCKNYMNYSCCQEYFTLEQMEQMVLFAAAGRDYLML